MFIAFLAICQVPSNDAINMHSLTAAAVFLKFILPEQGMGPGQVNDSVTSHKASTFLSLYLFTSDCQAVKSALLSC